MRRIRPAKKTAKIVKAAARREKAPSSIKSGVVKPAAGEGPDKEASLLTDKPSGGHVPDEGIKDLEGLCVTVEVRATGSPGLYIIAVRVPGYSCRPIIMHHVSMCEKYSEIALKMSESKWPLSLVFTPSKELAKNLLALLRHTHKISKSTAEYKAPTPEPTSSPSKDALGNKVIPLKSKTPPTHSQTTMAGTTYLPIDARVIPKEAKDRRRMVTSGLESWGVTQPAPTDPSVTPIPKLAHGPAQLETIMDIIEGRYKGAGACTPVPLELSPEVKSSRLLPDESVELASLFTQAVPENTAEPTNDYVDELLASEDNAKKESASAKQAARAHAQKAHQDFLASWGSPSEVRDALENNIHQILMDSLMSSTQLQKAAAAIYEEAICHKGGLSDLELGIDLQVTVTSPESPRAPLASVSLRNLVMD